MKLLYIVLICVLATGIRAGEAGDPPAEVDPSASDEPGQSEWQTAPEGAKALCFSQVVCGSENPEGCPECTGEEECPIVEPCPEVDPIECDTCEEPIVCDECECETCPEIPAPPARNVPRKLEYQVSASSCMNTERCAENMQKDCVDWNYSDVGCRDWLTVGDQRQDAWLLFVFEEPVLITRIDIWNQNEYSDVGSRDVSHVQFSYANEDGSAWTMSGEGDLTDSNAAKPNPVNEMDAQSLNLSPVLSQRWKIVLTSFHREKTVTGLMRVDFYGQEELPEMPLD